MWRWWVCVQSGPIDSHWLGNGERNEALVERLFIDVPEFRDAGTTAWNRGFVPRLHTHVLIGEWTYFYATNCGESEFPGRAAHSHMHLARPEFFRELALTGDLYLVHVDGWWEVYTNRTEWQQLLLSEFPDSYVRTWKKYGEPPGDPRLGESPA
jgi:hypothetical protein